MQFYIGSFGITMAILQHFPLRVALDVNVKDILLKADELYDKLEFEALEQHLMPYKVCVVNGCKIK